MGAFSTDEHEKYVAEIRLIDGGFSWIFNRKVEKIIEEIKSKHKPKEIKRLIIFSPASIVCENLGANWNGLDREVGKLIREERADEGSNTHIEGMPRSPRKSKASKECLPSKESPS